MAFRSLHDSDDLSDMAEINVTPLVDVMLVLLVIFMITAPMLTQGLDVKLPTAEGRSLEMASNQPSKVTILATGAVYVDGSPAGTTNLDATLGPMQAPKKTSAPVIHEPKPVIEQPKPVAKPEPKTAPPSPFGKSPKKPSELSGAAAPPPPRAGEAAGAPLSTEGPIGASIEGD